MVLRINDSDPTAEDRLSTKFGCDAQSVGPDLLKKAAEIGMKVIGIR